MNIRNEIKAQIVRAGFTMQDVVEQLADQYDWSGSVSNLSAKLQRESIRGEGLFYRSIAVHRAASTERNDHIRRGAYGRENAPYAPLLCPTDRGQAAQCQGDRRQQEKADLVAGRVLETHGEEISRSGAGRKCQRNRAHPHPAEAMVLLKNIFMIKM